MQRGDWLVFVLARVLCSVLWFHPLAWLALRELCREAEHAADDAVLAHGVRPSDYARLLVDLSRGGEPRVAALHAASPLVADRVRALLASRARQSRRWPVVAAVLVLASLAVPALAAWPAFRAPPEALTCQPGPADPDGSHLPSPLVSEP